MYSPNYANKTTSRSTYNALEKGGFLNTYDPEKSTIFWIGDSMSSQFWNIAVGMAQHGKVTSTA